MNQPNDDGWQHPAASEYSAATVALLTSATPCKCSKFGTQPAALSRRCYLWPIAPPRGSAATKFLRRGCGRPTTAPSTPAAVPIARGVVVVVDELGRVVGLVVSVIEGVPADAERLLMLLRLIQLLDDLAPHLLRHCGFDRLTDLVQLDLQVELELRRRIIAPRDRRHNTWDDRDGPDPRGDRGGLGPHGDWPEEG